MKEKYKKARDKDQDSSFTSKHWVNWNLRFIKTYRKIIGNRFKSKILDLGCGTNYFSKTCNKLGYTAEGIDIECTDFEKDRLPYKNGTFNVVHLNAVIEHIKNPSNIMNEIKRVLKPKGILIINTPNWQMDYKNVYNDPTHVKFYTPIGLKTLVEMFDFKSLFLEPALICKSNIYWRLPERIKWRICSLIKGGSKSILYIGEKNE